MEHLWAPTSSEWTWNFRTPPSKMAEHQWVKLGVKTTTPLNGQNFQSEQVPSLQLGLLFFRLQKTLRLGGNLGSTLQEQKPLVLLVANGWEKEFAAI